MELDLSTFQRLETFGWIIFACSLIFFCGHALVFLGICMLIRSLYMRLKTSKLGFLDTQDKAVLITGCDAGFGLGLAKHLYEKGFIVFATCLNPDSDGGKSLKIIKSDRLKVLELDVGSDDSVATCLRLVKRECDQKGLWGLVNNAGVQYVGDAELTTMDQYLQAANVNLYGMVRTCKAFLPLLRQAKGRIVNVTSVKGLAVVPLNAAYTITKFGGEAFSETLRQEMSQFGVKVSIVEPSNFCGITGILNDSNLKRLKENYDEIWREASEDAKQFYGQAHLQQQLENCKNAVPTSATSIDPVLDAFEDALRNPSPNVRYLISGSNSYWDFYALLARTAPFLPQTLFDKLRNYYVPYTIQK